MGDCTPSSVTATVQRPWTPSRCDLVIQYDCSRGFYSSDTIAVRFAI